MRKQSVNLWAVLVCVVLGQIIPVLWYAAFSDSWMTLNGFSADNMGSGTSPVPYIVSILSSAFTAYTLAWVFIKIPVRSLLSGLLTGLLFGVVFVLFETIVKDMFSLRPLLLSLINGGVGVVVFAMMGAVLGVWRKYE